MDPAARIVVVGATSAIAQHCLRLWAGRGAVDITLIGRDPARLERVRADLLARASGCAVRIDTPDFLDPAAIAAAAQRAVAHGTVDLVLIAHGSLPEQGRCESDVGACREALEINAVSPALFAEAFAGHLAAAGRGTLALIGSVAGDRGRKTNYVYGSAKALLDRYAQGLQHRFARSGVKVVLIKPGPTHTPMTAPLHARGARLAPPEQVAREIVDGLAAGRRVIYTPRKWEIIMFVIRHLPAVVFNRLNI